MVHVRMRHNDVTHSASLLVCQSNRDTAGVDSDAVVNQKTGQTLFQSRASLLVE
jgi:hypothetical protein